MSDSDSEEAPRTKSTRSEFLSKYEVLRDKIRAEQSEAQKGEASKLVLTHLAELQEIYTTVQTEKNTDTKIHLKDAEVLHDSAQFAAVNAKNLRLGDIGVSLTQTDFVKHVRGFLNENEAGVDNVETDDTDNVGTFNYYNWMKLGAVYLSQSKRPVSSDFLYGPLATERRKMAPRVRNIDDTVNGGLVSTAKQVQASEISVNQEQNTATMVRGVYLTFVRESSDQPMNFFEFFIDPDSFGQSVENLFFTSFLIRDSKLKLYKDENGVPMVERATPQDSNPSSSTTQDKPHHIAVFDYETWQQLIVKYNITSSFLGHREEPEDVVPEDMDVDSDSESESEAEPQESEVESDEVAVKKES